MTEFVPPNPENVFLYITDEDESPQRYPLMRLVVAVQDAIGGEIETWRIFRAWGQGLKTCQLEDALEAISLDDDLEITTETLRDLDQDPNEWFFDVVLRTPDRTLAFGIFDSGALFVEGPRELARQIGGHFEHVNETRSVASTPGDDTASPSTIESDADSESEPR